MATKSSIGVFFAFSRQLRQWQDHSHLLNGMNVEKYFVFIAIYALQFL